MLSLNKSYKNIKLSLTIHCKYKYFDSTVQRDEDRRRKFYFCRLPFAVNVKLNLSYFKKCGTFGTNDNLNRSLCPSLFSAEPSGNNRQRDIPGYLHMRRNFFLQLLPDMEEVYYNGSTSDEDERAIFYHNKTEL